MMITEEGPKRGSRSKWAMFYFFYFYFFFNLVQIILGLQVTTTQNAFILTSCKQ